MIAPLERLKTAWKTSERTEPDWQAAGWAGLLAGLLLIMLQMGLTPLFSEGGATDPLRRIAAIALGEAVLPPPSPFTSLVAWLAISIHLPLSLLYARLLAGLVYRLETDQAMLGGVVFGALLYVVNFYAFADVFPWFAQARGWSAVLSHLAYGAAAAGFYKSLEREGREI